jgi:hypothetical protein
MLTRNHSSGLVSWMFGEIATEPLIAEPETRYVDVVPSPFKSPFATALKAPLTALVLETLYEYM